VRTAFGEKKDDLRHRHDRAGRPHDIGRPLWLVASLCRGGLGPGGGKKKKKTRPISHLEAEKKETKEVMRAARQNQPTNFQKKKTQDLLSHGINFSHWQPNPSTRAI
jgi:hypothetical protein